MGTRNLTKVIDSNGVTKVAQYGQWDGYPGGQGLNALYHATSHRQIEAGLARVRWAEGPELEKIYAEENKDFTLIYPNLSRDTCADILGVVAWSVGEVILVDQSDFENDELFCEGVYTIDFQQRKFISLYDGKTVEFDLDYLPDPATYLLAWE